MNRHIIVLAGGGHGYVVLNTLKACKYKVFGILDPEKAVGDTMADVKILGGDNYLDHVNPKEYILVNGMGAIPHSRKSHDLFVSFKQKGFDFLKIQHPSVVYGGNTALEEGSQILAGVVLQCDVSVGLNSIVNTGANLDHHTKIGAHVFIGPGAVLCGNITVSDFAFIGAGSIILPNVFIGRHAIVGAGAIVTKNVNGATTVMGNPAKMRF